MSLFVIEDWVQSAIGHCLVSVTGLFHIYEGVRDSRPQDVYLIFDGVAPIKLTGGSDCVSINVSGTPLVEVNMSEYGTLSMCDISGESGFARFIGLKLASVFAVISSFESATIGVQFRFEEGNISILNLGDEIFVFDAVPEHVISDEEIYFALISENRDADSDHN